MYVQLTAMQKDFGRNFIHGDDASVRKFINSNFSQSEE